MKETADSKERINIPQGLSQKTDVTKTSRKIKIPPGGLCRTELRLSWWYESIITKLRLLIMVVPFLTCPQSFPLLGVDPARGRRRWGAVFGLRLVVVSLLSSFLGETAPSFSGSQKEKRNRAEHRANN